MPENTLSIGVESTPTGSSWKVSTFHDTAGQEHSVMGRKHVGILGSQGVMNSLGMFLVNHTQTCRTFQVRVDDQHLCLVLLFATFVEDGADSFTELNSTSSPLLGTTREQLSVVGRLNSSKDSSAFRVSSVKVFDGRLTEKEYLSALLSHSGLTDVTPTPWWRREREDFLQYPWS